MLVLSPAPWTVCCLHEQMRLTDNLIFHAGGHGLLVDLQPLPIVHGFRICYDVLHGESGLESKLLFENNGDTDDFRICTQGLFLCFLCFMQKFQRFAVLQLGEAERVAFGCYCLYNRMFVSSLYGAAKRTCMAKTNSKESRRWGRCFSWILYFLLIPDNLNCLILTPRHIHPQKPRLSPIKSANKTHEAADCCVF